MKEFFLKKNAEDEDTGKKFEKKLPTDEDAN